MGFFDRVDAHERTLARAENDHVIGIVSDRKNDPQWGPICRFTLPDQDNKVTGWIPVGQKSCVGTAEYFLPRIGERMLIQKLGNGPEDAVATHALYSTSVSAPPQANPDNVHLIHGGAGGQPFRGRNYRRVKSAIASPTEIRFLTSLPPGRFSRPFT